LPLQRGRGRTKASEILSVQTLRNTLLVSIFAGGYAWTAAVAYINEVVAAPGSGSNGLPPSVSDRRLASFAASNSLSNRDVRNLVLALLLFGAFVNFALTLRYGSHTGFLMGTATGQVSDAAVPVALTGAKDRAEDGAAASSGAAAAAAGMTAAPGGPASADADRKGPSPAQAPAAHTAVDVTGDPNGREIAAVDALSQRLEDAAASARRHHGLTADPMAMVDISRQISLEIDKDLRERRLGSGSSAAADAAGSGATTVVFAGPAAEGASVDSEAPEADSSKAAGKSRSGARSFTRLSRRVREQVDARVGTPLYALEAAVVAQRCDAFVRKMSMHFSLGFRCFYSAIPVAIYAAGAIPFMATSVMLLALLIYVDVGTAT
jgi:hypothetical protein